MAAESPAPEGRARRARLGLTAAGSANAHPGHDHAADALAARAVAVPSGSARETLDGVLHLLHSDDFAYRRAGLFYSLARGNQFLRLDVSRVSRVADLVGKRVRLTGRRSGDVFVVQEADRTRGPSARTLAAAAATERRVVVILVNFTSDAGTPWSPDTVRNVLFGASSSVAAYYRETSYGLTSLSGDVLGWFTIPHDNTGCRYSEWGSAARSAATAAGASISSYQHVMVAWPRASSCGWAGMASLGGGSSWINGSMTVRMVGHELGHNLSAHHASSLSCTQNGVRVTLSASCTASEYGDPFSIMGVSTRQQHNWHRSQMGWLPDVQTVTSAGTYTVAPVELTSTPRLVRVARGDGKFFYLEFRQPSGAYDAFGAGDPAVNGVTIRLAPDLSNRTQSLLLDTVPSTSSFADAPLAAGMTFVDGATGISIATLSVSA